MAVLSWAGSASAGTFPVVSTNDSGPGSLRQAITDANSSPDPANAIPISAAGTISLQSELPAISRPMNIDGPGASSLDVDGRNANRPGPLIGSVVFSIADNTTAEISGLTVSNASGRGGTGVFVGSGALPESNSDLTLNHVVVTGNHEDTANVAGGGIYITAGSTVILNASTISDNAISGGAGGGIHNAGSLTIADSVVDGNRGYTSGGIENLGTATITGSTVSGNTSVFTGSAAGIHNSGTLTLTDSTVDGNSAQMGVGGIENNGTMTIDSSTVSNNTSGGGSGAGGIQNGGNQGTGTLSITNSTVASNSIGSASACGGGVNNLGGTTTIISSTLAYNNADCGAGVSESANGLYVVSNSLIAANTGGNDCALQPGAAAVDSEGYNLVGTMTSCAGFTAVGDLANVADPGIGELADNGGSSQTIALLPGSPAIDAGNPAMPRSGGSACPAADQRGVARGGVGGRCDIGAFEVSPDPSTPSSSGTNSLLGDTIPAPSATASSSARVRSAVGLSAVSESHRRWRRGNSSLGVAGIARVRREPVGTTFHFTVREAAFVRFAFARAIPGRRVRDRCVTALRKQASKRPCSRTVTAGRFGFFARRGVNRVRFDGRISASTMLKPGRYSLTITAINPVGRATARLRFTIVS